ncbi:MAG: M23 family metallopeptidase [Lactobacillus sp.]|nr:M23 family metallopeptidase [Lactobacillus sp.]
MKFRKSIATITAALALTSSFAIGSSNIQAAKKKKANVVNTELAQDSQGPWVYPFAKLAKNGVNPMYNAQTFGKTDYARSLKPLSYFHDGWDFGWGEVGKSTVKAVHEGTVEKVAYGNGLGWFVWVISPDNYVQIYQEGFNKKKDISVKPGQTVKAGQKIGKLTGSHLHLGITKTNKNYINKNGYPCNNWYVDNGTWLNPIKVIQSNLNK